MAAKHPGITMHKISFGGGLEGLTFVIGSILIFVFGLPALWYFVAFALALGVGIAVFLRICSNRISQRRKPLSILAPTEMHPTSEVPPARGQERRRVLFRPLPKLSAT